MVSRPSTDEGRTVPETELAIDATDVGVTYDDGTAAVRGVDLAIERGEFFGFLGPNGAGKTTTVRTLVTLLSPTSGSVRVEGHAVEENPGAVRASIGYMAQETSVDEELTPRENLRIACDVYGVPTSDREDRIETLLELVELRDVADRRAETFSGGMKKRLDAATVLVHRPSIVFLDEPTTGLDPQARLRLWEYFQRINDRGTTVFLTTQYLEEADRLCDRIALLEAGQIVARGSPDALKDRVGGDTVEFHLADPDTHRARSVLASVPALESATVEPTESGVAITGKGVRGTASDSLLALAEAGVEVTDFDLRSPTLDDVFLSLTGDDEGTGTTHTVDDAATPMEVSR